jgi:FixJ family two-component response regulator
MSHSDHIVYVVDDDPQVCDAVQELLCSYGFSVTTFGSAAEYLRGVRPDLPACLLLDIELPDINGLDLQRQLADVPHPPIVFITGHGNIPASVRAMKEGALDFLSKPFQPQELLTAVKSALEHDRATRMAHEELANLRTRYASLTPRERDVLPLVVSGLLNKQAAAQLSISDVTLQIHRGQVMRKMGAASLSDLVRISNKLGIPIGTRSDASKTPSR